MADKTGICNMAVSHLGISKEIADVDTERSAEASACRRFYQPALDEALRDFANPFLKKKEALGLVDDLREVDGEEWAFSYRYPVDCSKAIRILSGTRNDTSKTRIAFKIISDDTGKLILTDQEDAVLEYCKTSDEPDKWNPDFVMAFSLLLAFYISPRVTAGDPFKLGERAYKGYLVSIRKSEANSLNEEQPEQDNDTDYIKARE